MSFAIKEFNAEYIPVVSAGMRIFESGKSCLPNAAAFTALSATHAADAGAWFPGEIKIIYSGFRPGALRSGEDTALDGNMIFTLSGAVYARRHLEVLKHAIETWLDGLSADAAGRVEFVYCGTDAGLVEEIFSDISNRRQVTINGFVPLDKLQEIQQRSFANLYVTSERTFHHKITELFAARRPIICYPPDNAEAGQLADRAGADFHDCGTPGEIVSALQRSFDQFPNSAAETGSGAEFSWDIQAEKLEIILSDAAGLTGPNG